MPKMRVFRLTVVALLCITTFAASSAQEITYQTPKQLRYRGPALNTTYNIRSGIQIDMFIDENSGVTGRATFIRLPGTLLLCGSGSITGRKVERDVFFQFVSDDNRLGCTFTQGVTFTFTGTLSADISMFQGVYTTDSRPMQQGIFTTTLVFEPYLPIILR